MTTHEVTTVMNSRPRGHRTTRTATAALALAAAMTLSCGTTATADTVPLGNPPGVHILNGDSTDSKETPCPVGWVCVYDGWYDYGAFAVLPGTDVADMSRVKLTDGKTLTGSLAVDGMINNSPVRYCWYEKSNYQGSHTMEPFSRDYKFSNFTSFKPC
ncbi:peptidase inhibitor family I36 protein [Kitasatospora sp. NPDC059812]|uniref:peptidase inhibitor family I36 protein n=1 Tax=Kitasatospora sp. NPDC059812 TaxID=3346958 RepID=UPI003653A767